MLSKAKASFLLSPAKINLALHVTGERQDGYHVFESLVAFTIFGDQIMVLPAVCDSFTIIGPFAHLVPTDDTNLVLKARNALRASFPKKSHPVEIVLKKNLPVAAGVGGGSSDAAVTLVALDQLWSLDMNIQTLHRIGLSCGADLPICLHGHRVGTPIIASGIGEQITPLDQLPSLPMVLVNNGNALPTDKVFRVLSRRNNLPLPQPRAFSTVEDVCIYLEDTRNDLYAAALTLVPELAVILDLLVECGARFAQMSGSGATCFAVFHDSRIAEQTARDIKAHYPHWFVVATQTQSSMMIHSLI